MRPTRSSKWPLLWLVLSGFAWPGSGERLVKELTAATSVRSKRDGLRLLRLYVAQGTWQPEGEPAPLAKLREDGDPEVRLDAVRLRAALVAGPAAWLDALADPAADVRVAALEALAQASLDEAAIESVLRAGGDPDARVRVATVHALGMVVSPQALAWLLRALSDGALEVRVAAAGALALRAEPRAVGALLVAADDALPELRAAAIGALASQHDARVDDALASALSDADRAVVLAALRGYARSFGERALPARVAELARGDAPVSSAARRLVERGVRTAAHDASSASADPPWLALLEQTASPLSTHESEQLLLQLEQALPEHAALASDALLEWMTHAPAALASRIAALIERSDGTLSSAVVMHQLQVAPSPQRVLYARLLAQAEPRADTQLLALLDDPDAQVRHEARELLARSSARATWTELLARLQRARGESRRELLYVWAASSAPLSQRLDAHERARLEAGLRDDLARRDELAAALALRLLGALDAHAAVRGALAHGTTRARAIAGLRASVADRSGDAQRLRAQLREHPDAPIAATAIVASALAGDPLADSWLLERTRGRDWPVGPAASFALAAAVSARAEDATSLCPSLEGKEPITRWNAAWSIVHSRSDRCGEQARETLARMQTNTPPGPQMAAQRGRPCALLLEDSRLLVSWPDAAGQIDWPGVTTIGRIDAWWRPYARP